MATPTKPAAHGDIVDIGGSGMRNFVEHRLRRCLTAIHKPNEPPALPDELLYDEEGLLIWNDIIAIPQFYQTQDEIEIFKRNADELVDRVQSGVTMIDLGAGDTKKVEHLLSAFERRRTQATYLALDISKTSLDKSIEYLVSQHADDDSIVTCAGLWGTFDHGFSHVESITTPRMFLSLGSVLCNDPWPIALANLRHWAQILRPNDCILIGMDGHMSPANRQKFWDAYHSCDDLFRTFFLNGFSHANRLLGEEAFREEDWKFAALLEEKPTTRHRFFLTAKRDIHIESVGRVISKGEELDWFDSHRYDEQGVRLMCAKANLVVEKVWQAPDSEFRQYLVRLKSDTDAKEDHDSAVSGVQ